MGGRLLVYNWADYHPLIEGFDKTTQICLYMIQYVKKKNTERVGTETIISFRFLKK